MARATIEAVLLDFVRLVLRCAHTQVIRLVRQRGRQRTAPIWVKCVAAYIDVTEVRRGPHRSSTIADLRPVNIRRGFQGTDNLWRVGPCATRATLAQLVNRLLDCVVHLVPKVCWKPHEPVEASWVSKTNRRIANVHIEIRAFIAADFVLAQKPSRGEIVVSGAIV